MHSIRPCRDDERAAILAIVNAAAEAYRGGIPDDRWQIDGQRGEEDAARALARPAWSANEPYMGLAELDREIADGVAFWGFEEEGELIGVMGIQRVGDVDLIRHAYVLPGRQGRGVGRALLEHLRRLT